MKRRKFGAPLLMLALLAATLTVVSPASALAAAPSEDRQSSSGQPDVDHIIVETFTLTGERVSTEAFSSDGSPIPVPADFESRGVVKASAATLAEVTLTNAVEGDGYAPDGVGSGGSSSSSGCREVTVKNEKKDHLGFSVFWFNTWTSWCWDRSTWTTYDVSTGYFLDDVDPLYEWRDLIVDHADFYRWQTGFPESGYRHEKQGHFEYCVPKLLCIGSFYPRNILKSHSDGTWTWSTSD